VFEPEEATETAVRDAEAAVETVLNENRPVDLEPVPPPLRRLQHTIAAERGLPSQSRGRDPFRGVTFYPPIAPERPG
jgi:predicted RNA-binding protein Jag